MYAHRRHVRNLKKKRKVIYPDVLTDRDMQRTSEQIPLLFFFIPSAPPAGVHLNNFRYVFSSVHSLQVYT